MTEKMLSKKNWDSIRIIEPMCYVPPVWEIIIASKLDELYEVEPKIREMITEELRDDPHPDPWRQTRLEKHFKARIQIVETLVERELLDRDIGMMAIGHFKNHLEELKATPITLP